MVTINKNLFFLLIAVAVIGLFFYINSNFKDVRVLKQANKELNKKIEVLNHDNKIMAFEIKMDSVKIIKLRNEIKILIMSDSTNKKNLNKITTKYDKLKDIYNSGNDVSRDSIFSALIHN